MVIPFSFTFTSPALHKYASASSLSKSSKFLILKFLMKCCKLDSVFKILSKSHVLKKILILSKYYKFSYKLWYFLSKSLNSPNLYISWACSIVSRVFIYASNKLFCGTLIINLGKNSICACYCKEIKTSFARIK